MSISVCTLAFGRAAHLVNLVRGLLEQEQMPDELFVAVMQKERYELPPAPFPVRQVLLGEEGIPLASARNRAAREASGELLIFLDVDCIPAPSLIGDYARAISGRQGVFMGEVAYLPKAATDEGIDFARFDELGVKHSERAGPPETLLAPCNDYRCFWSLNFAMASRSFARIGGFDDRYRGYGGEDTDFGRVVVTNELPLWWVRGAKAYHQHHAHHMPPVHHLDSVLANVHRFMEKWGEPTMQHWLRAFVLMGLIERRGERWIKLRDPGERELAMTRQQADQPYASSASVLAELEAQAASGQSAREPGNAAAAIA